MHNASTPNPRLPHHKLIAHQVAIELLVAVKNAHIRDTTLRNEALRAAKSTCLNTAEAAGRVTRADKARALAIARGECVEPWPPSRSPRSLETPSRPAPADVPPSPTGSSL